MVISRGIGPHSGFAASTVALLAYNAVMIGITGLFSFFAQSIVADLTGVELPWWVWAAVVIAVVAFMGYRDVHLSARVLGVLMILEVAILVLFSVVVFFTGGHDGLNVEAFTPSNVFSGDVGLAFLFAFSAFIGVEATVIYGEEAKNPERSVPRATYIAVALTGGFYVLVTYALGIGYGTDRVVGVAASNPGNFVFDVNTQYVGAWSTLIMKVLVITSLFAVLLALHNTCARYLFALGRGRMLPSTLGVSHRKHLSPHRASLVETVVTVVVVGAFLLAGADPFDSLYAWSVGLGTVAIIVLQFSACIAVIGFFRRVRTGRSLWTTVIAPALAACGLGFALVISVVYFDSMTGVSHGPVTWLPILVPIVAVIGLLWGRRRRRTHDAALDEGFVAAETEGRA